VTAPSTAQAELQVDGTALDEVHVLVVIDHLVMGGAEMLVSQFAAAAPSAGLRVSVACLEERDGNPAAAALRRTGIEPVNLNLPGRPSLRTVFGVARHIRRSRPDIIHTHLGDADLVGGLAARLNEIPMVSTIHTSAWEDAFKTRLKRRIVRRCASRIIAVSDAARRDYAARGFGRPGQLVTIHNGIEVPAAPEAGREIRRELGWRADDLVIGMVSALRVVKAHDVAIEAVLELIEAFSGLRLLIVGDGPEREHVARFAERLGDHVAMVGRRLDVMRYFDAFDICLHPSRAEAFPTTLIESMAASVPVVATAVGGIPEIVADGETGVLVAPPPSAGRLAAAIAPLLRDPDRRRELGRAGRRSYETNFTATPWIRATRELYNEVLRESADRDASVAR
jgi:glycosyltransferase involved in cell wall biosynthesis